MRYLALLLALLMCGFTGSGTPGGRGGAPSGGGGVQGEYVTIVVFGDTQYAMLESSGAIDGAGRYAEFNDTVDWIIANKTTENIDLVLHVGDMIDSGTALPLSSSCDSWVTVRTGGECSPEVTQVGCEAIDGCGWTPTATPSCATCNLVNQANAEWPRFNTVWQRLHAAGIPAIIAKGNHDNTGNDVNAGREPDGFDDYYSDAYWTSRETDWSSYDFVELDAYRRADGTNAGTSRAYLTDLDGEQFLIVTPSYQSGTGVDPGRLAWMEDVLTDYPTTPAIVLTHWYGEVQSYIDSYIDQSPNIALIFSGHNGWGNVVPGNIVDVYDNGADTLINLGIDHNNGSAATYVGGVRGGGSAQLDLGGVLQDDYVAIVRYYPATQEIEIDRYSAQGGLVTPANGYINDTVNLGAELQVAKTAHFMRPPILNPNALYDLTPYESEILTAFSDDVYSENAPPAWAIQPGTTEAGGALETCTVTPAGDEGSLSSCLSTGNRRVVIPAGQYDGSLLFNDDNVWIDAADDAIFYGGFTTTGNFVKVTGGTWYNGTFSLAVNNSDITYDNVYLEGLDQTTGRSVTLCNGCTRLTAMNSTIRMTRPVGLMGGGTRGYSTDIIFANMELWSDYRDDGVTASCPSGSSSNGCGPEYAFRVQYVRRLIMVDTKARVASADTPESNKPGLRIHYDAQHQLYVNNYFQCGNPCGRPVWIDTDAGSGESADLETIYLINNKLETTDPSASLSDVVLDDSTVGGPGIHGAHFINNVSYSPGNTVWSVSPQQGTDWIYTESGNTGALLSPAVLTPFNGAAARTGIWPTGD